MLTAHRVVGSLTAVRFRAGALRCAARSGEHSGEGAAGTRSTGVKRARRWDRARRAGRLPVCAGQRRASATSRAASTTRGPTRSGTESASMTTPTLPSTPVTPIRGAAAPLAPASSSPWVRV